MPLSGLKGHFAAVGTRDSHQIILDVLLARSSQKRDFYVRSQLIDAFTIQGLYREVCYS